MAIMISLSGYYFEISSKKMFIMSVFTSGKKRVKDSPDNGATQE